MIIKENKLIADEGMALTNGDAFGKTVWLASGDDGSMWREITDAEAEILKREKLEAQDADYEAALGFGGEFQWIKRH